jgi:hypothetical protein
LWRFDVAEQILIDDVLVSIDREFCADFPTEIINEILAGP